MGVQGFRWRGAVVGLLCAIPALMVLLACRGKPGMSPDSVFYAAAARSFAADATFTNYDGSRLTIFPPGLPALLGTLIRLGAPLQGSVLVINVLSVVASVILVHLIARRVLRSPNAALLVTAVFALSNAIVLVFTMLWSETLFTALVLLALYLLVRAPEITWGRIVLLAAVVSAAGALRFVGFTLIPVVAIGVWLGCRRWWPTLAAAALASIGTLLVAVFNVSRGASPFGTRAANGRTPAMVVDDTAHTLGQYLFPLPQPAAWQVAVGVVFAVLVVVGAVRSRGARPAQVLITFVVIFWCVLAYSEIATGIDPVDTRLTIAVFAPMLILAAAAFDGLRMPALIAVLMVMLAIVVVRNVTRSAWLVDIYASYGIGYNSDVSLQSPLARSLGSLPPGVVAANDGPQAYWVSGRTPVANVPFVRTAPEAFVRACRDGEVRFIAMFDGVNNPYGFPDLSLTADQLRAAGVRMRVLQQYPDGTLYEVETAYMAS